MYDNSSIENQVIVALRRINRAVDLYSRVLLHEYGLTAPQLAALQVVGKSQGTSVSTVARAIHLSLATVTGIFNRLESRELVKRSRNGSDRRTVTVELTPAGADLLKSNPSLLQHNFRRELARLKPWEQTQLLASLQRIAAMMDAEGIEAASVRGAGTVATLPEDVSQYMDKAVPSAEESEPAAGRLPQENGLPSPDAKGVPRCQ